MSIAIGKLIGVGKVSIAAWSLGTVAISGRILAQQKETTAITLDKIIDKWKERDQHTESFDFICDGEHFEIGEFAGPARRKDSDDAVPDDISHRHRRFILSKDGRTRFEEDGREWDDEKKLYVPRRTIDVFDGKSRNTFSTGGQVGFPAASFNWRNGPTFGRDLRNSPLRMALCPFRRGVGEFDATTLVLTDEKTTIDQRPVLVLKSGDKKLWVDPDKDYLPVKRVDEIHGFVDKVLEISYSRDKIHGWVPSAWSISLLDQAGKTTWKDTTVVSKFSINKTFADSEFELVLLYGTWVRNFATDETYILRANGEKRPILRGEYNGKNYQELLESEPKKK